MSSDCRAGGCRSDNQISFDRDRVRDDQHVLLLSAKLGGIGLTPPLHRIQRAFSFVCVKDTL